MRQGADHAVQRRVQKERQQGERGRWKVYSEGKNVPSGEAFVKHLVVAREDHGEIYPAFGEEPRVMVIEDKACLGSAPRLRLSTLALNQPVSPLPIAGRLTDRAFASTPDASQGKGGASQDSPVPAGANSGLTTSSR